MGSSDSDYDELYRPPDPNYPSFKAQLMRDVQQAFLNPREFADQHCFNGHDVVGLVSNASFGQNEYYSQRGLYEGVINFTVAQDALPVFPRSGDTVTLDGLEYAVIDLKIRGGICTFVLSQIRM